MPNRYPIILPNTPGFDVNDNATQAEQEAVFSNPSSDTGIVDHGYSGADSIVSPTYAGGLVIANPGSLVIAPAQSSGGSEAQALKLAGGKNVAVTIAGNDATISAGNQLVTGGLAGGTTNILLNLPNAEGTYRGRPIWNYSAMERIDALPPYQANRARLLDQLADIVESNEYDFFIIALPANASDAEIAWKDTLRLQLTVPPESLLLMILADSPSISAPPS
jgi:hypothetical protein